MALLFLNDDHEAACFKTAGAESYLKWMADASPTSGILGIQQERQLYLGHQDASGIEKVFTIDYDTVRLTRPPKESLQGHPKDPDSPAPLWTVVDRWDDGATSLQSTQSTQSRPVIDIQESLKVLTDGSLRQSKEAYFEKGMVIHNGLQVVYNDDLPRLSIQESNIHLNASHMTLNASNVSYTADQLSLNAFHTDFRGTVCVHDALNIYDALTVHSNARIQHHLFVEKDISAATLHVNNGVFQSLKVSQGLDVQETTVALANQTAVFASNAIFFHPPTEFQHDVWLSSGIAKISVGSKKENTWDTAGHLKTTGCLTLTSPNAQHSIQGSIQINGRTQLSGKTHLYDACVIGQPHRSADLCVYGTTHLSQPLYAHHRAYFERPVVCQADLQFNGGKSPRDRQLHLSKGALEITEGCLWVNCNGISGHVFGVSGTSFLGGDVVVKGALQAASLNILGDTQFAKRVVCDQSLTVAGDLKTDGSFTVGDAFRIQPSEGIVVSTGIPVSLQGSSLSVAGDIDTHHLRVRKDVAIESGTLSLQNTFKIRHRRYGLYEPMMSQQRWFQWMHIPYGRGGCTHFYLRIQGQFFTPTSTKTIDVEFGGSAKQPTTKRAAVWGGLIGNDGLPADAFATLWVYQHSETLDYTGYIELQRRLPVGFELQIECGAYRDVFQWKAMGTLSPTEEDPKKNAWWKPLDYPEERHTAETVSWMARTGIGESNPLYALDVRAEARFQSKILHPFNPLLAKRLNVPTVVHGDQSYAAIGDLLEALATRLNP